MPGLTSSSSYPRFFVIQHDSARHYLSFASPTLRKHEASSNIVLAHALKAVGADGALNFYERISEEDVAARVPSAAFDMFTPRATGEASWLTLWSTSPSGIPTLDLILAAVNWTLGEYPIFLWTPHRASASSPQWLQPRIQTIVDHLNQIVPPERVFSVFGLTPLIKTFSRVWTQMTGFVVEPEPFYAALFSYCTAETFREADAPLPEGHQLRKGSSPA